MIFKGCKQVIFDLDDRCVCIKTHGRIFEGEVVTVKAVNKDFCVTVVIERINENAMRYFRTEYIRDGKSHLFPLKWLTDKERFIFELTGILPK